MHSTKKIVGYIAYAAAVLIFLEAASILYAGRGVGEFAIAVLLGLVLIAITKWVMPGAVDETKQ